MVQNSKVSGQTLNAQTESTLAIELFLNENYAFRRNVLNGKVEFAEKQPAPEELETTDGQAPADPSTASSFEPRERKSAKKAVPSNPLRIM